MGFTPILIFKNPTQLLFTTTLVIGTLIVTSSTNWLSCWVGLEINLLSFIPLIYSLSQYASESALKYFLVQALASATLLLFIILVVTQFNIRWFNSQLSNEYTIYLILTSLFLKTGAAPFHFWLPVVAEGLSWLVLAILLTWQKIAPFILILYLAKPNLFNLSVIILSALVGALGGFNQTSLRKIIAYSSINHIGWIIRRILIGNTLWVTYFLLYTFLSVTVIRILQELNLNYLKQLFNLGCLRNPIKMLVFGRLFSIGGLPPFLGFFPKWLIIQSLLEIGLGSLATWLVFISLITLYFYTRVAYAALMITHSELKWFRLNPLKLSPSTIIITLTSLAGLPLCPILTLFI